MEINLNDSGKNIIKSIKVQIITNYFCNFNCEFCYLGKLRQNKDIINLEFLKNNLLDIAKFYKIESIGILGGEPTLLTNLQDIVNISKEFCKEINIITNLSNGFPINNVNYSTSLNKERDQYKETRFKLLINNNKDIGLNIVITPSVLNKPIKLFIEELEQYGLNIELIRYSLSQNNEITYDIDDRDFENYLKNFIIEYLKKPRNFKLNNIEMIESCLNKEYSPLMDSVIFITPNNKFAYVEYLNNKEHFNEVNTIELFRFKAEKELNEYTKKCSQCKYFMNCYAEHLKLNQECSGLKNLLKWYEENIYKNDGSL